jgi:hypothetical protein
MASSCWQASAAASAWLALAGAAASAAGDAAPIYLSDLSRCTPRGALAGQPKDGHWQLIRYETVDANVPSGTMICALSFVDAPDVTLRLGVSGWHAVYVAFWNPHWAYDGGLTIKAKVSGDPCFTRFTDPEPQGRTDPTYLRESYLTAADLTGRDLVFGKVHGPHGRKACIAYVKLVPLSAAQVAALQADRARTDTRCLEALIDGTSYFWANEYSTREHLLELVERYRYSDVGKVVWAACNGSVTNYPSAFGTFLGGGHELTVTARTNQDASGIKALSEGLRSFANHGEIPEAVVARHVHAMGLKFDLMFRLGIGMIWDAALPPMLRLKARTFTQSHPEFRQALADGTPVQKMSYAYPQVRGLMLSIIEEACRTFDVDGANLCFTRGPQFMQYEKPVLDEFRRLYGTDGTGVGFDDPRLRQVRCSYLTQFVGDARRVLDRVGREQGKHLALSAFVFRDWDSNLNAGMDLQEWLEKGYLDGIVCPSDRFVNILPDPALIAAAKARNVRFTWCAWGGPDNWLQAHKQGADGILVWDMDGAQDAPAWWAMASRMGHRAELEAFVTQPAALTSVKLKSLDGADVLRGIADAVYSGG